MPINCVSTITPKTNYLPLNNMTDSISDAKTTYDIKKTGIGILSALTIIGISSAILYKGKIFKPSNSINRNIYCKNGLIYKRKNNELFSGIQKKINKNGSTLKTSYKNGLIIEREYYPTNKDFKSLIKTYDYTHPDVILIKGTKVMKNGEIKYSNSAILKDRKFPNEIEEKIRMVDFDKLSYNDKIKNAQKIIENNSDITYDLGNNLLIKKKNNSITLLHNGKMIREKLFYKHTNCINNGKFYLFTDEIDNTQSLKIITPTGFKMYYNNGNITTVHFYDEKGNILKDIISQTTDALGKPLDE